MKRVTLVYAYYDNPKMLSRQIDEWSLYPELALENIRFVIVDDASPVSPALDVIRARGLYNGIDIDVYRIGIDKPWGQDGARNIGMKEATTDWCLLTDMDHMLPHARAMSLLGFVNSGAKRGEYYMPMRIRTSGALYHPHPNTFLFSREDFWEMGGYDEDFVGWYGSDGNFRKCARGSGLREVLTEEFRVVLYGSDDIDDAHTRTLSRKEGPLWAVHNPVLNAKRMGPAYRAINPVRAAYRRVL